MYRDAFVVARRLDHDTQLNFREISLVSIISKPAGKLLRHDARNNLAAFSVVISLWY